eukprot:PRCOL_00002608-RA
MPLAPLRRRGAPPPVPVGLRAGRRRRARAHAGARASRTAAVEGADSGACEEFTACPRCKGWGERAARTPGARAPCGRCGGRGVVPGAPPAPRAGAGTVGVVGAGIGGCALALALRQRGVRCELLERDESFDARKAGYGFTLQQANSTLRALGIDSALLGVPTGAHYTHEARTGRVVGAYGHAIASRGGIASGGDSDCEHGRRKRRPRRNNLHLPRQTLRWELLARLDAGAVRWGAALESFEEVGESVVVRLADGSERAYACLVGADGIRSPVRAQLDTRISRAISGGLRYLGCVVLLGITELHHPWVEERRVWQSIDAREGDGAGDGNSRAVRLFAMPFDEAGRYMWQLSFAMEEDEAQALAQARDAEGIQRLKRVAVDAVAGWHDPVPAMVAATPCELVSAYPAYDRPVAEPGDLRSREDSRVTVLGDAAHPMSMFKGQGANCALADAVALARRLSATPELSVSGGGRLESVGAALAEFESEMLARTSSKVRLSHEAVELLHSRRALAEGDCTRRTAAAVASADGPRGS